MQPSTIEMVTFSPKAGVSAEQLKATAPAMTEFLQQQDGFLYRSLSEDQGLWYDIIYWSDLDAAKAAGEEFMQHPAGQAMMKLIDVDSTQMRHMTAVAEAMGEPTSQDS